MTAMLADQKRAIWNAKPMLRAVYGDYLRRMRNELTDGPTLEIGSGGGYLCEAIPHAIAFDIRAAPWLDIVGDAEALPFAPASLANIVMIDVLHHLAHPLAFLEQAADALRPGGRLIAIEPAITPLSSIFYRLLHTEPVDMRADPWSSTALSGADPDDSNQAIPTLLFARGRDRFTRTNPRLAIARVDYLSLWAYPLSGGFQNWSLLPAALAAPLLQIEDSLLPLIGRLAAFRLFCVLERRGGRS